MDGAAFISVMIAICMIFFAIVLFMGPLKFIAKLLINAGIGLFGIYMLNMFFPSVAVGMNLFTAAFTGVLGIPGFAALIIAASIL